jgi:hypothetical protein
MRGEGGRSGKYKPQWNGISYFLCKLLRISLSCGKKTAPCTIDKNAESSIATWLKLRHFARRKSARGGHRIATSFLSLL